MQQLIYNEEIKSFDLHKDLKEKESFFFATVFEEW